MLTDAILQGILFTLGSSLACILGASIVFADVFLQGFPQFNGFNLLESRAFLSCSLGLASGVMLFSSIYILLPTSRVHLADSPFFSNHLNLSLFVFYLCGILFTLTLNAVICHFIPDAINTCGHNHIEPFEGETASVEPIRLSHPHSPAFDERAKLLAEPHTHGNGYGAYTHSHDHLHSHSHSHDHLHPHSHSFSHDHSSPNGNIDTLIDVDGVHSALLSKSGHSSVAARGRRREEDGKDRSQFMTMGIQTALAIGLHKFPEGLITFISTQASPTLGFSVFLAIALHNVTEGLMIAIPLYVATGSRVRSFWYAALLGGMSQPLGALIGVFIIKAIGEGWENLMFGIVFAVVGGMMCVIVVQSMFPQAIKADTKHRYVTPWFFVGALLVGLTSVLE